MCCEIAEVVISGFSVRSRWYADSQVCFDRVELIAVSPDLARDPSQNACRK